MNCTKMNCTQSSLHTAPLALVRVHDENESRARMDAQNAIARQKACAP